MVVENRPAGNRRELARRWRRPRPTGTRCSRRLRRWRSSQSMVKDLAFDPRRDLAPIALVGVIPNVLVAGPRTPAKTLAELLELARRNPGKLELLFDRRRHLRAPVRGAAQVLRRRGYRACALPRRGGGDRRRSSPATWTSWSIRCRRRCRISAPARCARRGDECAARAAAAGGADDDRVGISGFRDQRLVGRGDDRRHAGRDHRAARVGDQTRALAAAGRRSLRNAGLTVRFVGAAEFGNSGTRRSRSSRSRSSIPAR